MLQKCGCIEEIPDKYKDKKECLNHVKCRNYFKYVPCEESTQDEIILNINLEVFGIISINVGLKILVLLIKSS